MKEERKFGWASSSANPKEISLTVASAVRLVTSILVSLGIVTTTGADALIEQAPVIALAAYSAYELCQVIWGAVRKVIVAVSEKKV